MKVCGWKSFQKHHGGTLSQGNHVLLECRLLLMPTWSCCLGMKENNFPTNLSGAVVKEGIERSALKIDNADHNFLVEVARQRTSLDYEETVYGSLKDGNEASSDSEEESGEVSDEELSDIE